MMSRKMAAAQALQGEFSEDGLAAMAGGARERCRGPIHEELSNWF